MSESSSNEKSESKEMVVRTPIGEIPELSQISEYLTDAAKQEIKLSRTESRNVVKALQEQSFLGDHASLPMTCVGPKCPMAKSCPLQQIDKAPIGQRCPIEMAIMNKRKDGYIDSLQADWEDQIDRQAVMDLVEADILQARANGIIADEGFIMENVVGVSETTGQPIYRKEKHIAVDIKDMLYKRRERLLKSMVATKEAKKKLGVNSKDPSSREAELLDRVRKAIKRDGKVKDAEIVPDTKGEK